MAQYHLGGKIQINNVKTIIYYVIDYLYQEPASPADVMLYGKKSRIGMDESAPREWV